MAPEKKYGTLAIERNKLEAWPNPSPHRPYLIRFDIPEFTCLCPQSGFPDFATIRIRYRPKELIVELKSLKLYIVAYRNVGIFYENAVNRILRDCVAACQPRRMAITGVFSSRGGISSTIAARYADGAFGV